MTANYINLPTTQTFKFHEGWLDHRSQDGHWARYWCVLNNDAILFFNSNTTCMEALVGTIALGSQPKIEKDVEDESSYKFDLFSLKRINTFKAAIFLERELWKAYVEGIESGRAPKGIDLLPEQIKEIQIALNALSQQKAFSRPISSQQETSPLSPMDCFDTPNTSTSGSFDSDNRDNGDYLEHVSPTFSINEKLPHGKIFCSDLTRTDVPSWFFSNCSRDQAVLILDKGRKFGNTLMREGTNHPKNLAISQRMEIFGKGTCIHFVVTLHSSGYKIDVEEHHQPMKSLSEIMEFFVELSGRASTFPMTTNDVTKFGISETVYDYYKCKYKMVPCLFGAPVTDNMEIMRSAIKHSSQTQSVVNSSLPPKHPPPVPPFFPPNRPAPGPPSLTPNHPASVPQSLPPNSRPPLKHSASLDTACHGPGVPSKSSRDKKGIQLLSTFKRSSDLYESVENLTFSILDCLNVKSSFVDIIANYDDIKAVRAARGSFSGPSTDTFFTPSMRRSQSEMCKNNSLEENF